MASKNTEQDNKIYKYQLSLGETTIKLPESFQVLHVGEQNGLLMLWVELDLNASKIPYTFHVIGTGHSVKPHMHHIGSVIMNPFVWHVYFDDDPIYTT
jgi:hypothetical protein